ncbi:MAG: type I-E CRISPR-associated protein Cas7/Cse4/CasC, partial [Anaerolineaceae bacterium]|nr:type I-E CRISPR-associated protein Cas7/Cse4/CasC [Anaerolineaceae bacterium]
MFIELHFIQNFAPSNLNRDESGNPKECDFGGVRRARISSQCIKRSIRTSPIFTKYTSAELGYRTRWITQYLLDPLQQKGLQFEDANELAMLFANAFLGEDKKNPGRTTMVIYMSIEEVDIVAQQLADNKDAILSADDKDVKDILARIIKDLVKKSKDRTSAPDIALFGRMLASEPKFNLDASCQVAHAISTHRISMDMDFFTAADDLEGGDAAGAAMMGVTGFNSACFYRYMRLDTRQLLMNLDGDK